jgi:hypothetical protein
MSLYPTTLVVSFTLIPFHTTYSPTAIMATTSGVLPVASIDVSYHTLHSGVESS